MVREWEEPSFEEFQHDHSAWRLFNATTYAITGRVAENPAVTKQLHRIIDGVCEAVH